MITLLVGGVLATIPSFVIWCFSGLESALFALTVVVIATVLFHAVLDFRLDTTKVAVMAGGLAALAALTRPDGLIAAKVVANLGRRIVTVTAMVAVMLAAGAGLADATIAKYTRDDDKAGLRDHLFDVVRPTFIVSHGIWDDGTGVARDPRIHRDYYEIYRHGEANDWVRKDAVSGLDKLNAARQYASRTVPVVDQRIRDLPRRSCGEKLRAGQVNGAESP